MTNLRFNKRIVSVILFVCAAALFCTGIYLLLRQWEMSRDVVYARTEPLHSENREITYNGITYKINDDIATYLLLGIDTEGKMRSYDSYINDAQCDFITLVILNREEDTFTLLQLNRDTMTEVRRLGLGGIAYDSVEMQLALSHTYGDGMEESCENTVIAVENLLGGIDIDHYISINMTGMAKLVDAIGGVDVTITDDFSAVDPSFVQGQTMHLNGKQCVTYIRSRSGVGDQTNLTRTERQQAFIKELMPKLSEKTGFAADAIAKAADYMLSDLSGNRMLSLFGDISEMECTEITTPAGETTMGKEFIEFHVDEPALQELIVRLFYLPAE